MKDAKVTSKPFYVLADVQAAVAGGRMVLKKSKAREPLQRHTGTPLKAKQFAKKTITKLTDANFSEAVKQAFDTDCDVYGIREDGVTWYIKFYEDYEQTDADEYTDKIVVMSFHPAEHPIETKGGRLEL